LRTTKTDQPSLFDPPPSVPAPPDQAAREYAIDPAHDVVLEASAGTGKTRVLVDRYVRLMQAGVDPRHVLAMTFTRKAAAEMRDRVIAELRRRAADGTLAPPVWSRLRDRLADIEISTIDAFCFSLLREFPLEADVDPGFDVADETEMARFADEALDLTFRVVRPLLVEDECVRLLFARIKLPVLRRAIGQLIDRREIALPAVAAFVARRRHTADASQAALTFARRLERELLHSSHRGALLDDGPLASPAFAHVRADLIALPSWTADDDPARAQELRRRLERYFLTKQGTPRQRLPRRITAGLFASPAARKRHEAAVRQTASVVAAAIGALDTDVDTLLARGVLRVLTIALRQYEQLLQEHTLLDFAGMLSRAVRLLDRQEEFARSRLKLQARYHHLLIDEFQDTSRLQWRLISRLIDAWGEGEGVVDAPTSIFVVGDRKQSIYRFRHADVTLLDEAARRITALRPARAARRTIVASYRSVPELLAFVNALSEEMQGPDDLPERFRYTEHDRFPVGDVGPGARRDGHPVLGLIGEPTMEACADAVAREIERLLAGAVVRNREGPPRRIVPDDIAILFRARTGHQSFEEAIEARRIRTYVHKGLGFFDAPEVQDLQALLRFLARPESDRRAAEWLRSRLVRLSDAGLARLAPAFSRAVRDPGFEPSAAGLDALDLAVLQRARTASQQWLALADRVPPAELVDVILRESTYAFELRGRRSRQARENVKKVRTVVRRVGSRGYATLERLASYFETLRAGEESNAVVEAAGAVNLMTIHAAKGLEFPVVVVVNLHQPGRRRAAGISVIERGPGDEPVVAFGSSAATEIEEQRETEELRRLLYVAVTRARDRLYLAGETEAGTLRRPQRSLAALLPPSLAAAFGAASSPGAPGGVPGQDDEYVRWEHRTGSFDFRVCRPACSPIDTIAPAPDAIPGARPVIDTPTIRVPGPVRASVTGVDSPGTLEAGSPPRSLAAASDRLLGTIVHRLFQRATSLPLDVPALRHTVAGLVKPAEMVDVDDPDAFATAAAELYARLRGRADVMQLLGSGQCLYEVPFTFVPDDRPDVLLRGVIDCVVMAPDGQATVVEFKTGAARPEHRAQASLYASALAAALGLPSIDHKIVYA